VDVALNGDEGLSLARDQDYDALILDIMLPGTNGYRICSMLRHESIWTPILMLSAKDGDLDEAEELDTGADDFLSKPFSYTVLVARLRALLRRGARERPVVLSVGDLFLDPATRRCSRAGTVVALSPREFSLLEFLMRHPGEVLPKAEILEHVWDFAFDGDLNIVEVYVGQLRRKIDDPFSVRSIETVRGVGYRLSADGG
jgi:two-component system, OmpR family, response regulator